MLMTTTTNSGYIVYEAIWVNRSYIVYEACMLKINKEIVIERECMYDDNQTV